MTAQAQQLELLAPFTTDAQGAGSFSFGPVPQSLAWRGNVNVPGAPFTTSFVAQVENVPWGFWQGPFGYGPIRVGSNLTLNIEVTGATPSTAFLASFIGVSDLADVFEPVMQAPAAAAGAGGGAPVPATLVINFTGTGNNEAFGPFPTSNVTGYRLAATRSNGAGAGNELILSWLDDTATTVIATERVFIDNLAPVAASGPHRGAFLIVQFADFIGGNFTGSLHLWLTSSDRVTWSNIVSNDTSVHIPDVILYSDSQVVVPGTVALARSHAIYAGPALFAVRSQNGAVWSAALQALADDSTFHTLATIDQTTVAAAGGFAEVIVPPAPLRVNYTNGDGVNKTPVVSLTADAWR